MAQILPFLRQPHRYPSNRPPTWPYALNLDSQITQGMVFCLVPQPGGFVFDLVQNLMYGPAAQGENITTLSVVAPTFTDTDGDGFALRGESPATQLSMAAWVIFRGTSGVGDHNIFQNVSTSNGHFLQAQDYTAGFNYRLNMGWQTNATNRNLVNGTDALDLENFTNIPLLLGGSVDAKSTQEIYQQGDQVATGNTADSSLVFDASIWNFGEEEGGHKCVAWGDPFRIYVGSGYQCC